MTSPYDNPFGNPDAQSGASDAQASRANSYGQYDSYGQYGQGHGQQGYQQAYPQPGYQQPYHPQYAQGYGQMQAYGQQPMHAYGPNGMPHAPKSKVVAALLAFFLGWTGAHNFYLGNTGRAIVQLLFCGGGWFLGWLLTATLILAIIGLPLVLIAGGISLWIFVEFILILAGAGGYDRDAQGYPLQ